MIFEAYGGVSCAWLLIENYGYWLYTCHDQAARLLSHHEMVQSLCVELSNYMINAAFVGRLICGNIFDHASNLIRQGNPFSLVLHNLQNPWFNNAMIHNFGLPNRECLQHSIRHDEPRSNSSNQSFLNAKSLLGCAFPLSNWLLTMVMEVENPPYRVTYCGHTPGN